MASLDAAVSIGEQFRRFWRWWLGELRECAPSAIVHWLSRVRIAPLVVPEDGGFAVYRFDGALWRRVAKVAGETAEALANVLGTELRKLGIEHFAVGLLPGQFLAKTIMLPQAAEDNLRYTLHYELDRHTPFKPDDVGFDCCVVGRNESTREIAVNLVIAPKASISQAVANVAGAGLLVTSVRPGFPERSTLHIDLLPHDENGNAHLLRLKRWFPWVLLAVLALTALLLPIYQKRAQVIELLPQVNVAAQQAQVTDALRQQLERAQAEYNYVLQKRYATPTSLQLLAEVTRILPDDTWLQSFELRTMSKGREVQLQGETGVAGKMIELFEQSPLLAGASFKSPVTQAPGSQASRFHLGMEVKEVAPPAPRAMAQAPEPAPTPARGAPTPPAADVPTSPTVGTPKLPATGGSTPPPPTAALPAPANTATAVAVGSSARVGGAPGK